MAQAPFWNPCLALPFQPWDCKINNRQVGEAGMDEWARTLATRPFGEEAVGWEVEVFSEVDKTWKPGIVQEFSGGEYRV